MSNLTTTRIKTKLTKEYESHVDMSDCSHPKEDSNYISSFLSRALAAFSLTTLSTISIEDSSSCITDGYHDFGIDAIYNDLSGKKLFFVQSKWSNDGNSTIQSGDLHKFIAGVKKVVNFDFSGFNNKLISHESNIINALSDFDYSVKMIITYNSKQSISAECTEILDGFISQMNDIDELFSYEIVDAPKIYATMSNPSNFEKVNISDLLLYNWGFVEIEEKKKAYYGTISAELLADWFETHGHSLLEKNIRFFKGDTDVNKGILSVINNEPENFYLYNNGIKIIADKIIRSLGNSATRDIASLKLEGASIVNGAQTTGSIHQIFIEDKSKLENVKVHVQIIELDVNNRLMEEKITKLSNTQNRIESKDFATLDREQERLRRELYIDEIDYIYKHGVNSYRFSNFCTIDQATIALGCYCNDVSISSTMKKAYGSIFDDLSKAPYKMIFNGSVSSYLLWNTVKIYGEFLNIENTFQKAASLKEKQISIHGNRFILHILFQELKKDSLISNEKYMSTSEIDSLQLKEKYKEIVLKVLQAKSQEFPDAYPANIFKNNARCKLIKGHL